jgi:hypothetical protein
MKTDRIMMKCLIVAVFASLPFVNANATAKTIGAVTAGELIVDPATLTNLGFEWVISGDDNRNAKVDVSYRRKGSVAWKTAMPLMRVGGEHVYWGNAEADDHIINVVVPQMFAGSILDLEPGTVYEARFVLSDPDGGNTTRIVTAATRPEPRPFVGGHVYHVYPPDWKGAKEPHSYVGLNCAYNYHCGGGDESMADRPRVQAGDIILVHAGVYGSLYDWYSRNSSTRPVEGTYYLFGNGTADRPIVIKAAGDGEVIFDGRGNFNLFNVQKANYNYFEGLTFRNTEIAIQAGLQMIAGSSGLTVKQCRFENINLGIVTSYSGSRDFTITDNVFIGRDDPNHLQGWNGDFWLQFNGVDEQEFPAKLKSYTAVRVYGAGHVVAYNYVANFHDGIDVETYGNPDGSDAVRGPLYPPRKDWDHRPVAIDFYNNYLTNFHDNAIEIDGSLHNIRVMRNLMLNSASHPFCNQPAIGGPVYWIRNVAYNAPFGVARMSSGAAGVVFLNNTMFSEFVAPTSGNLHLANNLILGQNANPEIFAVHTFTNYSDSDYNGFRPNPGARNSFQWTSPPWTVLQDYHDLLETAGPRTLTTRDYQTLAAYSADAHHDQHSIVVEFDAFERVQPLDATDVKSVQKLYKAEDLDFRLRAGSAAIDKGKVIPQVTDGYTGTAPDLGAIEFGQPLPHYGPRNQESRPASNRK